LSKEKFDHDIHADSAEGLVVRGRTTDKRGNGSSGKNRSKFRNPHSGKTCNFYGKLGHIVANCWKLKKKKEKEEKENQSKKPAIADCVVKYESDGDVLVATMSLATTSGKGVDDDWILYSGCTYHMCPHRNWLVTYEPVDTGIVLMGNDTECKVVGIGTVKIKTHDGVVRTLSKFDTFLM